MTARKGAKNLAAAIRQAMRELPKGWEIKISIERDSLVVSARAEHAHKCILPLASMSVGDVERGGWTLRKQIDFCLRAAINHEAIRGHDRRGSRRDPA